MRKLAIAVALSSTVLATPALARDGALYVGGEFGAMIVEDIDVDIGTRQDAITLDHEYGYDGAGFVGYDFGAFRVEAEVGYKKARLDSLQGTVRLPGEGATFGADRQDVSGSTSALSFMVNGMLDFGDDEGISGFVGGGVGMARVKFNNQRVFENRGPFLDDSDTRFAWQVIAGVRQAITDNVDVHIKYRFFNVDNIRMNAVTAVAAQGGDSESRFRSHSLLGGLTFNFGAAPPPPAPLPPPPPPPPPPPEPAPPAPPAPVAVGPFIVFFDWDRSDITPQAAAILDNAAAAYQQTGQAQVVLAGHADRSGSAQYNVGLSQRRADSVRSYLAGRGVPDGAIATEAFGESRPLVETADGVREPQNRRVEITFGPGAGM
jgi:outer membrane protein OmpA-like peptidoglycan-associated protein